MHLPNTWRILLECSMCTWGNVLYWNKGPHETNLSIDPSLIERDIKGFIEHKGCSNLFIYSNDTWQVSWEKIKMKEENLKNEMLVGASMTLFETPIGMGVTFLWNACPIRRPPTAPKNLEQVFRYDKMMSA